MIALNKNELLGQGNTVVLIDETFVTKRKVNRGQFLGRATMGHKTCIIAFLELDRTSRQYTVQTFVKIINNRRRPTIEALIKSKIDPAPRAGPMALRHTNGMEQVRHGGNSCHILQDCIGIG